MGRTKTLRHLDKNRTTRVTFFKKEPFSPALRRQFYAWKLALRWDPSQSGFLEDWPQRHSATCGPHGMGSPLLSRTSISPLINRGPFFSAWIFTSAINNLLIHIPL